MPALTFTVIGIPELQKLGQGLMVGISITTSVLDGGAVTPMLAALLLSNKT
jgi:hypothetical protein